MKIVDIFVEEFPGHLYAFVYTDRETNEYDRLMDLWTDMSYLWKYAKQNNVKDVKSFVKKISKDAENIDNLIYELFTQSKPLEQYFRPLNDNETGIKVLSLQKGKTSKYDGLRIYAIKIDINCFVITGGAIKMSHKMKHHSDTRDELEKIKKAKNFLKENSVVDKDSFCELKTELE